MPDDDVEQRPLPWGKVVALSMLAAIFALLFLFASPLRYTMQAAAVFFELNSNKVPLVLAPGGTASRRGHKCNHSSCQ